jgi:hypothetical protein
VRKSHFDPLIRGLRVALTGVFWLQGTFGILSPSDVHAQNPDTMVVSFRPASTAPPAAVTDLLASANPSVQGQIATSWTSPQGNVGGVPINNQTVASYTVYYATFSITSIGGSTSAWLAHPAVSQSVLSSPGYTPQPPGSFEGTTLTGLAPGTVYYFSVRSTSIGGVVSPIDTESSTPGQQANALSASLAPTTPATFVGTALSPTSIQWTWSLAPFTTSYLIYSQPGNTLLQTLSDPTTYWIETGLSTNTLSTHVIKSSNTYGASSGRTGSVTTLAAPPINLSVTGVTATAADLIWNSGGNPFGTLYSLERSLNNITFSPLSAFTTTSATDTGLLGDTDYYYRIQALNGDNIPTLYSNIVSTHTAPAFVTPQKPNGMIATVTAATFSIQWHAVTEGVAGQPVMISQYRIDRYTDIASSAPNKSILVSGTTLTYNEARLTTTQYYTITALASGGGVSEASDFSDSSLAGNRYTLAPDDLTTRVVIPEAVSKELRKENNIYGEDLELRFVRRQQDERDTTLRSYNIGAYIARTGSEVFNFAFSKPIISVQMGYAAALGSPGLQQTNQALSINRSTTGSNNAGSIAQIIAVYWNNGRDFVKISDPILTSTQALSVIVRALGTYQVRAARIANQFSLAPGSPYPRVITPNGAENRKVFFFFDNPTDSDVAGAIYDIRGAKVRDLHVDGMSPTTSSIVWDGRDSNGAVVPSGVYLYKIAAGKDKATGSLVVAR